MRIFLPLFLVASLFVHPIFAATHTVKAGGGGDYTTIQACATAMAAGDTCTVYAGTYNENVTVTAGTAGNFKTFNVNGTDSVYVLSFNINSYTKIIGFHIQNPSAPHDRACVYINNDTNSFYLTNNVITQCGQSGGAMVWTGNGTGASNVYIQGNTLSWGCGTPTAPDACNGINAFGDHFLIENNDLSHVGLDIYVASTYTVIRNNYLHDTYQSECTSNPGCHTDLIFSEPGSGLPARYNLWEGNIGRTVVGSDGKGFLAQGDSCAGGCYNLIIRFNDVAHLGGGGITDENAGRSDINPGFHHVKSYNNTWVDLNSYAQLYAYTNNYGNNSTYAANINDLFYYPEALVSFNPYATDSTTTATFSASHNLAYCTASPCNIYGAGTSSAPFTADPGNIVADPRFVDYSANDFHLSSGSPAIGTGTYLTTVASGDSGSGTSLVLNDASFFQDGLGLTGVNSDWIRVGASTTVHISAVNYATNTITLANSISRSSGDPVYLYKDSSGVVQLWGANPDIGALQYGSPTITEVGHDSLTTTSVRFYWTAGYYHDAASDVTLTDGFTSTNGDSGTTIHVSSTSGWVGYTTSWPTTFILNGNEWGRVVSVTDSTHAVVQFTDPGGFGGGDRTEFLYKTYDGLTMTCTSGICTVTTPYAYPFWWVAGHPIRINYSNVSGLDNNSWSVLDTSDSTHFRFDTSGAVANGTYDVTTSPDLWLQSGLGIVHAGGGVETISLIGSDAILCYGDPGGSAGTYGHSNNTESAVSFPHAAQGQKHFSYLTNQTPGSTIHYVLMSTPRQFGNSSCSSPGVHTAVTADDTITFPASESTTPVAPVGVSFSTAPPGGTVHAIGSSGCATLQACLTTVRALAGNHVITIPAGTTITAPVSPGFILPPQTNGSLVTTIRTDAADSSLPAQGACVPPISSANDTPATSPCIDNPNYASFLATIQTGDSSTASTVFSVAPNTNASGIHLGPGLKIQANPAYAFGGHSSLVDFGHNQGDGIYSHANHSTNVVIDRVYFYQKNIQNGAYNAVRFQGFVSNALVDCVVENIVNRTQDIGGGLELDGIDTSDTGVIISNNRIMAQMPIFLGDAGWNTSDVLIQRNWLHNNRSWNRLNKEWTKQVSLPVASATAGTTTTIVLSQPSEWGITAFTSLNNEPLNFEGATGNWTQLNSKDFQLLDSTLSDFNCDGTHCIATTTSAHGLTTGDSAWVGGLNGSPCFSEVGGHTITVTDSTHFQYTSGTNAHCLYSQVFVTAPVFFTTLGDGTNLPITLNSTGFGALTGTVIAHYGAIVNAKNTGEFKTGKRIEVKGNRFENSITVQQNATAFALTNRVLGFEHHQFGFNATISDIYFHDNWMLNFAKGISYIGIQDNGSNIPSTRIKISNVLGTDSNSLQCTPGESCFAEGLQFSLGTHMVYDHLTLLTASNASSSGSSPPPSFGDMSITNSIFNFAGQGFGSNGGSIFGAQLFMTSGTCTAGPCNVANPSFPDAMTSLRNVFIGDACAGGNCVSGDDFGFQRRYYDGYTSGKYNTGNQADSADYQNTFWPHYFAGVGFSGITAITNATNASPIVLTTGTLPCVPSAGDRVWVSGVQGNYAANGNIVVKSATSTSITLLTGGGGATGAYTSGGTVMPLTGACNVPANWTLTSSSNYKAGKSFVGATDYLIDPTSTGTGDALDSTDIGVNIATLVSNLAGVSPTKVRGSGTFKGSVKVH